MNVPSEHRWGYVEYYVYVKDSQKRVVINGEETIRSAVAFVFPGVPHQLCQFHYLKDATKLHDVADRHAKKQLKKHLRGVRPIERALEERSTPENEAIRGYCLAVRAALPGRWAFTFAAFRSQIVRSHHPGE